ncbi:hypothetical protein GCM10022408_38160 [Hymenobacter fastidiosus]|uniref:Uncharacterized protein n=1 Tax=Hymenobacter fastidiosus TaxID=486264 RepID=A0ABP7T3X4_9BACT
MKQKTIAFQSERCPETNGHAQTLCRSFLKHGYRIYIVTNLPEQEFADHICDFALDNGIYHRNILFRKSDDCGNPVEQLKLTLFFSANEFEVRALNEGNPRPVACHLPYAQPAK